MEPAIEDTQPRHAHHSFLSVIPQLVICDGKQKQRQTFFDVSKDRYYTESIPEMCNKFIYACSHGWLVLLTVESPASQTWLLLAHAPSCHRSPASQTWLLLAHAPSCHQLKPCKSNMAPASTCSYL
jgi:hypothetical protein